MPQIGIAVERARLTHLWGEPVALALPNGSLTAVSDETQPLGIRAGQTAAGARALSPKLVVLPYDRQAYEEAARAIWDLLAIESSVVEPVSPELCYVEMNGPDITERTERVTNALFARVRITVTAGLARTKFVALQAALAIRARPANRKYQDSGGCPPEVASERLVRIVILPADERCLLAGVPIDRLTLLNDKVKQRLAMLGVRTLGDVGKLPARDLDRQFRDLGVTLRRLAQGRDIDPVRPLWPPPSVEEKIEFEPEVNDSAQVQEALRRLSESVCGRLLGEYARSVVMDIRLADGDVVVETEKPASPINTPRSLERSAERLFARMHVARPVAAIMLRACDISCGSGVQLTLLDRNDQATGLPHERSGALNSTESYLRRRFGPQAVVAGAKLREAKRIGLWTYPLGHLRDEPVRVVTDRRGAPIRFWRGGIPLDVQRIHDRWKEADWNGGDLSERAVYRVETDAHGLWELQRNGACWRIRGVAD